MLLAGRTLIFSIGFAWGWSSVFELRLGARQFQIIGLRRGEKEFYRNPSAGEPVARGDGFELCLHVRCSANLLYNTFSFLLPARSVVDSLQMFICGTTLAEVVEILTSGTPQARCLPWAFSMGFTSVSVSSRARKRLERL